MTTARTLGRPLLGFGLPVSGSWATAANLTEIATSAEAAGYDSLWSFQRLLHPVGAQWGSTYESVADPLITLGFVAAQTQRVRLGVAVLNAPFFSPIQLAKQIATLDLVSNGRLDVGLGLGWAPEEFAAVGVPMQHRGRRTEEFIRCLRHILVDDQVSFDGEFYHVPLSTIEPKPVQRPQPPILLGGSVDAALRRVGRLADGWISSSRQNLSDIGSAVRLIKDAASAAGRDAEQLRIVVRGVAKLTASSAGGASRKPLQGNASDIAGDLERLAEQGVTEVFLDPNFDPEIGSPSVDPAAAMLAARRLLEACAPAA
ncbi:MAG: family F420-dependent class oxidoreductase [Frankiales bacterium]|nr:family F420-dependent class oxidoreductase [Frankiales bacterium]